MNRVWLKLIGVMIIAGIAKYAVLSVYFWVVVDLAALVVCYFMLRAVPYINLKTTMWFLSGFTCINILVDLGVISGLLGNLFALVVIGWLLWRNSSGSPRPPLRHKWHK